MTFGSLFAGIGGFDLGLERAGMKCEWQCEIKEDARKILKTHWPDVVRPRDAIWLDASTRRWAVNVLAGGFPCQDVSLARSTRAGLAGRRSGLFFDFLRIAE
jgi:DNA (cytosine-5)-methyltransferase 1